MPKPVPWWTGPGEAAPTFLTRHDGRALLYAGKVNSIIGPSEQGKSWLALLAVLQALRDGRGVTYVDMESDGGSIGGRLRQMGATDRELARLAYVQPDARYLPMPMYSDLIVLDGINALLALHGVDGNNTNEVTAFNRYVFEPWAASGACVAGLDHVGKPGPGGAQTTAIGSQAKKSVISGSSLRLKMTTTFGRSKLGKATVFVEKDRPGHIRGIECPDHSIAELIADDRNGTKIELQVSPWVDKEANAQDRQVTLDKQFEEALSRGPQSRQGLADLLSFSPTESKYRDALMRLIANGSITVQKQGKVMLHFWREPLGDV